MLFNYLPFFLILLCFFFIYTKSHLDAFIFFIIPLTIISYFTISIVIFSFGEILPFNFFDGEKIQSYTWIQIYILLHFIFLYFGSKLTDYFFSSSQYQLETRAVQPRTRFLGFPYFLFAISPAILILLAVDFAELYHRYTFVAESKNNIMRFADMIFFLSAITTPLLRSTILRYITLISVVLCFAMVGSRSASIYIIIFVLTELFVLKKRTYLLHVLLMLLAFYILAITLSLRSDNQGGLVAILNKIQIFSITDFFIWMSFGLNYIFNFSVIINAEMMSVNTIKSELFNYSILPLPSSFYDFTTVYDAETRFRKSIPYPGFGYAITYLGIYSYLLIAFFCGIIFETIRNMLSKRRDFIEMSVFFTVINLPFLISLQYNLRTSTRLLYLFVLLYFTLAIIRRIKFKNLWRRS